MRKTRVSSSQEVTVDDMRPEYDFDYRKARPNRFADRSKQERLVVVLDPDIAQVFTTPESVNNVLRALIAAMPKTPKQQVAVK
jgi:hypothetical protein